MHIIIESWHTYSADKPMEWSFPHGKDYPMGDIIQNKEIFDSIQIALWLGEVLSPHTIKHLILHDEIEHKDKDITRMWFFFARTHMQLRELFTQRDQSVTIKLESAYIPDALEESIQTIIQQNENAQVLDDWKVIKIWKKDIKLLWYMWNDSIPSCEVLDYTFSQIEKNTEKCDLAINILHEKYQAQQSKVIKLLQSTWVPCNLLILFYDNSGNVVKIRKHFSSPSEDINKLTHFIEKATRA